jgi:hypothetical protein
MLSAIMLSIAFHCYAECLYAECLHVECLYADCLHADCHYAECHGAPNKKAALALLTSLHFLSKLQMGPIS